MSILATKICSLSCFSFWSRHFYISLPFFHLGCLGALQHVLQLAYLGSQVSLHPPCRISCFAGERMPSPVFFFFWVRYHLCFVLIESQGWIPLFGGKRCQYEEVEIAIAWWTGAVSGARPWPGLCMATRPTAVEDGSKVRIIEPLGKL